MKNLTSDYNPEMAEKIREAAKAEPTSSFSSPELFQAHLDQLKTNLLPCPFCGGNASEYGTEGTDWVDCDDCNASTYVYAAGSGEAEKAWNQRTHNAKVNPPVERPSYSFVED